MVQVEHELQFSLRVEPRLARAGDGLGLFARHAQRGTGRARGDLLRRVPAVEDGAADRAEVAQSLRVGTACHSSAPRPWLHQCRASGKRDRYACTIASQSEFLAPAACEGEYLLHETVDGSPTSSTTTYPGDGNTYPGVTIDFNTTDTTADYDNMYDLFTIVVHKSSANYFEIKTIAYYGQAEPNPYSARTRGFPRRLALEEKASSYTPFNLT